MNNITVEWNPLEQRCRNFTEDLQKLLWKYNAMITAEAADYSGGFNLEVRMLDESEKVIFSKTLSDEIRGRI